MNMIEDFQIKILITEINTAATVALEKLKNIIVMQILTL